MKTFYFALLGALPAVASETPNDNSNIHVLDQGVTIKVQSANRGHFDETPIWQILEKQGWKAAQQAAKHKPISEKLAGELQYQSQLAALSSAMKKRNYQTAGNLLNKHPNWSNCQRIQWAWLDLKHETRTGFGPEAQKKYQNIANNCSQYGFSTTQKVMSWTAKSTWPAVLDQYRQSKAYKASGYSSLAYQLHLEQLSDNSNDPKLQQQVAKQAKKVHCPLGSELLGWQYLEKEDYDAALLWFDRTVNWSRKPSQKQIEGKLLSLNGLNRTEEYDAVYNQWVKRYPGLKKHTPDAQSKQLASTCESQPVACLKLLEQQKSMTAEQHALAGWQWYKLKRPLTAKRDFEKALQGLKADTEEYENALFGYSLSLNRAGFQQQAETSAEKLQQPENKALFAKQRASQNILNAYERQDYQFVIEQSKNFEQQFGPEIGMTEMKGWAYYNQKQNTRAVETFQQLVDAYPYDENYKEALKTAQCAQKKSYKQCN